MNIVDELMEEETKKGALERWPPDALGPAKTEECFKGVIWHDWPDSLPERQWSVSGASPYGGDNLRTNSGIVA